MIDAFHLDAPCYRLPHALWEILRLFQRPTDPREVISAASADDRERIREALEEGLSVRILLPCPVQLSTQEGAAAEEVRRHYLQRKASARRGSPSPPRLP